MINPPSKVYDLLATRLNPYPVFSYHLHNIYTILSLEKKKVFVAYVSYKLKQRVQFPTLTEYKYKGYSESKDTSPVKRQGNFVFQKWQCCCVR
jgi:hypothetical protein